MTWPEPGVDLTLVDWPGYWAWVAALESEIRGAALLLHHLLGLDPALPRRQAALGAALTCSTHHVLLRLDALAARGLLRYERTRHYHLLIQLLPFPIAPGREPPAPLPPVPGAVLRPVKRLKGVAGPVLRPVPPLGRGDPSSRPAWTRWRLKAKTARAWVPEDFLGYWVCRFREVYEYEDPDFRLALSVLNSYRTQVRLYIEKFLAGDKDRFRAYVDHCFEKALNGELDRARPLRWGQVVNFRKTGFLTSFLAVPAPGAVAPAPAARGRRGGDARWSDPGAWERGEETE